MAADGLKITARAVIANTAWSQLVSVSYGHLQGLGDSKRTGDAACTESPVLSPDFALVSVESQENLGFHNLLFLPIYHKMQCNSSLQNRLFRALTPNSLL